MSSADHSAPHTQNYLCIPPPPGFDGFTREFDLTPYLPHEGVANVGNIFERMGSCRERVLIRSAIFFAYTIVAVSKGYTYTDSLCDLCKCHGGDRGVGNKARNWVCAPWHIAGVPLCNLSPVRETCFRPWNTSHAVPCNEDPRTMSLRPWSPRRRTENRDRGALLEPAQPRPPQQER